MVQVCATLSAANDTEGDFTITLATTGGDDTGWSDDKNHCLSILVYNLATAQSDYTSVSSNRVFTSGSTDNDTRCVNITVEDDEALEGDETFTVTLTTSHPNVIIGQVMTTVTIMDNDC